MEIKEISIRDGNKLIAEFMGGKAHQNEGWLIDGIPGLPKTFQLSYHSSWDWLQPVVKKVFEANGNAGIGLFKAVDFYTDNIKGVWDSVVQFLTWLSTQSITEK